MDVHWNGLTCCLRLNHESFPYLSVLETTHRIAVAFPAAAEAEGFRQ